MQQLPKLLIILFTVCFTSFGFTQSNNNNTKQQYLWFDSVIGIENTGIYKGTSYVELYRVINEKHKFHETSDFTLGEVIYDNQPYFDLQLKYDLFEDQLLVAHPVGNSTQVMILIADKIKSFTLNDGNFINTNKLSIKQGRGFCEVLTRNGASQLLKKYFKRPIKKLDKRSIYYEFREETTYVLFYKGEFYDIKNVRDLFEAYPENKNEIRQFAKDYAALKKSNKDRFMTSVVERLFKSVTH